jgi:hypothetical protein
LNKIRLPVPKTHKKHLCAEPECRFAVLASALVLSMIVAGLSQAPTAKAVGTVKSVNPNSVVITMDSGTETIVTFAGSPRILRAAPGQTDLKSASPIQISDIQVGDRLFARGQSGDGGALIASSVIVMSKGDIAQRQQTERDEWRRGVGGIVKQVDAVAGTITIANSLAASGKPITVHVSSQTATRRYAPDSIKFDDAKPGTLDQIKPGDQLRARGTKNADGTEFAAQAIVSGSFRDIAGTVVSTDAANKNVTLMDLATKKPVVVSVSSDSELRKLPPLVATRIAMRLKGGSPDAAADAGVPGRSRPEAATTDSGQGGGNRVWQGRGAPGDTGGGQWGGGRGMQGGPGGTSRGNGGTPDFQQMLSRMPAISISDLNKGDAVMLVATEGNSSSGPTAIKLISGVEPLLSAAPAGAGAAMILSPWNLGGESPGTGGGDSATQ